MSKVRVRVRGRLITEFIKEVEFRAKKGRGSSEGSGGGEAEY